MMQLVCIMRIGDPRCPLAPHLHPGWNRLEGGHSLPYCTGKATLRATAMPIVLPNRAAMR